MPERIYDHFVLTRFNVRLNERASDDWLRHRLAYFESMCMPSVLNQTSKNFRWLVFFDAERNDWFDAEVQRLSGRGFEAVWVDGPLTAETVIRTVCERSTAEWVITTRLDNDDAISRNFISEVQVRIGQPSTHFINFTSGLQLSDSGELYYRSDPSNAFISLVEKRADMMGVYVDWHDRVSRYAPVRQVSVEPMWVQMVHGRNIGNAIRGIRANPDILEKNFSVQLGATPVTKFELVFSQIRSASTLALRIVCKPSRLIWLAKVVQAKLNKSGAQL